MKMIAEVYDALLDAGADDTKARAAAQAVADYDRDIAELKSQVRLHGWMLATNLALSLAILWRVF